MYSLIAASAFFLVIHFGVSVTRLRDVEEDTPTRQNATRRSAPVPSSAQ
jgi:hypothetical protein